MARAKQFKAKVEHDQAAGTYVDPRLGARTLRNWATEWIGFNQVRPATKAKNSSLLTNHILPALGGLPLARITERDYLQFVATLSDKGLSPASIRSVVNTLTAVINAAVVSGLLVKSPKPHRLRFPDNDAAEAVFLSHSEVARLVDATPERHQALVILLAGTGLRWSEAAGLTRQRLDLMRKRLTVAESYTDGRFQSVKNRASRRTIGLAQSTTEALAEHLRLFRSDATDPGDMVFTGMQGRGLDDNHWRARVWRPAVARAGLDPAPTPHDLRHSHAAHLIAVGWHPKAISARLGHTSITTTMDLYGHLFPDHEAPGLDRLDHVAQGSRVRTVYESGGS